MPAGKTLEQLISEANSYGYLVTNLTQFSDRKWRANVRREQSHKFHFGTTAVEALEAAVDEVAAEELFS